MGAGTQAAESLRVVTTIAQIADVVRAVAGDKAEVSSLMGEAVDPHTYRQTRSDIVKLRRADLILYNGLYLEAQLEDLLLKLKERQPVVAVGEMIDPDRLLSHPLYPGKFDPHVWMDVSLWRETLPGLVDTLSKLRPGARAEFEARATAYGEKLDALDQYIRDLVQELPEKNRLLVTAHDAFRYFGRAYGIEVMGIQGLSTESEAGLERIESLVDILVERQIPAIFVESSVADRNVMALLEGASAESHKVKIGGSLFSDAMGAPLTYEGTYIGMLDHNATTIANALGAEVPAGGWQGKLGLGN